MIRAAVDGGKQVVGATRWMSGLRRGGLLLLALGLTACGGGGGGASSSPSAPAAPTQPPVSSSPGRGTLAVTVTDALGSPIAGAEVWIDSDQANEDKYAYTDSGGKVEVSGVYAGRADVRAYNSEATGWRTRVTVPVNAVQQVTVVAVPAAEGASGVAAATVRPGGVSDDGRTVEFALSIIQVPHPSAGEYWAWGPDAVRVMACALDEGRALWIQRSVAQPYDATEFKTALLLDQSAGVIVSDPADKRLFATKYLMLRAGEKRRFAVAGFAADDATSGQPALLPQKPATILPVDNPQYTSDGRALFQAVDSLATLEGGGAPVFAAIDRMLDFGAAGPQEVSALIVVTDGRDTTCGPASQCRTRRDALLQKSRDKGVRVVTVGLARSPGNWDREALAFATQSGSQGAAFWASEPRQLAPVLDVAERYARGEVDSLRVGFRIRSEAAGTFVSGRTILGRVRYEICPMDCSYTYVPFAVKIP